MSRTSVIPNLIDALISEFTAWPNLSTVITSDVIDVSDSPGYRIFVGAPGPNAFTPFTSAQADQTWPNANPVSRDETGSVNCSVYGYTGSTNPKIVRDECFRIAGEIQTILRTNIQQGVPGLMWTSYTGQVFEQAPTQDGSKAVLSFHIDFKARL